MTCASGTNPPAPERALINRDGDLYVTFDDLPGPNVIDYGLVEKCSRSAASGGFVGITQDPTPAGSVTVSTMDRWYPVDTVYVTHDSGSTRINLGLITSSAGGDGPRFGNYYARSISHSG